MPKLLTPLDAPNAVASAAGLLIGVDTNLYRSAADVLKTDDALVVSTFEAIGQAVLAANERLRVNSALIDAAAGSFGVRSLLSNAHAAASAVGLYAVSAETIVTGTGGDTGIVAGSQSQATYNASGSGSNVNGALFYVTHGASGGGISTARGFYARVDNNHATNPIVNAYGVVVANNIGAGPITNQVGFDIQALIATGYAAGLRIAEPATATTRRAIDLSSTSGNQAGGITFGNDVTLYRLLADTLATDDRFISMRAAASDQALTTRIAGLNGWTMTANGTMSWADAAGTIDTNLYRVGVDTLKTDDKFVAGGGLQLPVGAVSGYVLQSDGSGNGAWAAVATPEVNVSSAGPSPRVGEVLWVDTDDSVTLTGAINILAQAPVLDVGLVGQIRAGRQLTVADFTNMGLSQPLGLWNLSNLTNLGSDGRALVNKGTVPFNVGINGAAATAAQFVGATTQVLYIADSGAADPYRITTGSFGCWARTAKRGAIQYVLSKLSAAAGNYAWRIYLGTNNTSTVSVSLDGTAIFDVPSSTDVCDDRWHFLVATHDGTMLRNYVDGVLEASAIVSGMIIAGNGPVNISGYGGDAGTNIAAGSAHYGSIDEAFVTSDILSEDQVRNLYCAKVAHSLALVPTAARLAVTRRRRGVALVAADFPTQPLRLHNMTGVGAAKLTDQGSNNVPLVFNGTPADTAGADGGVSSGVSFAGGATMSATDAGLPSGTASRSYGCWVKNTTYATNPAFLSLGSGASTSAHALWISATSGGVVHRSQAGTGDDILGPFIADGQWHFVLIVEDNAASDGVKRKLYVDGRVVGGSTVMNALTLAGANRFRVGSWPDGTAPFTGQVDGVFVCGYALTTVDIAKLYAKGSQALMPSPKNAGDHVEAWDATSVLATFDAFDSTALIDMGLEA